MATGVVSTPLPLEHASEKSNVSRRMRFPHKPSQCTRKCRRIWSRALVDHPTFHEFQAAIEETLAGLATIHAKQLESLMTLNFQRFENVSLLAA